MHHAKLKRNTHARRITCLFPTALDVFGILIWTNKQIACQPTKSRNLVLVPAYLILFELLRSASITCYWR
jgi:hypothetical protein